MIENSLWTVLAVVPMTLFFVLFYLFNVLTRNEPKTEWALDKYYKNPPHSGTQYIQQKKSLLKTVLLNIGLAKEVSND
jgi:hypothetical protein